MPVRRIRVTKYLSLLFVSDVFRLDGVLPLFVLLFKVKNLAPDLSWMSPGFWQPTLWTADLSLFHLLPAGRAGRGLAAALRHLFWLGDDRLVWIYDLTEQVRSEQSTLV